MKDGGKQSGVRESLHAKQEATGDSLAGDSSERRAPDEIGRDLAAMPLAEQLRIAAGLLDCAAVADDTRKRNPHRVAYAIVNRAAGDLASMVTQ